MKSAATVSTRSLLLAFMLFGTAAIAFVPTSESASQRFRNATLAWYDDTMNTSFDDATLHRLIDHLKSVGYDGITFQITVDVDVTGKVLDSKPKTRMWQMLDYAAEIGLGTAIQVNWSAGNNVALDKYDTPAGFSIPKFLEGVRLFFQTLAPTAQAHGATMIYLGYHCDNVVAPAYHAPWAEIIDDIRQVFTGRIAYIGWYGVDFDDIGIWDLVDAIGAEVHMEYPVMPLYDVDQIEAGYFHRDHAPNNVIADLIKLARQYQKPLVFGSLYFMNLDNALDGWDPTPAQALQDPLPLNPAAQKAGYQAALEVIAKNLDGFVFGINFSLYEPWGYHTFTAGDSLPVNDAAVLNAFKYVGALAGPTTDFPGTEAERLIAHYLQQPWGYHTTDVTTGGPGDDIIYVSSGDNTIHPKGGRDEIHGGAGFDSVVLEGESGAYTITTDATSVIVCETAHDGNVVTADRIELLRFSDRAIDVHHPAAPALATAPASQTAAPGQAISLAASTSNGDAAFQWRLNGSSLAAATNASLSLEHLQPEDSGVYTVRVENSVGSTESDPAIVGLEISDKVIGAGDVVGSDIPHPNGNIFDQVLLNGRAEAITAENKKVTRTSFVDLNDDIVQVEFSGPGTLSLVLDDASAPAPAVNYNQPGVAYVKGHAGIVITGATEQTNASVFTVGRATAVNPALFKDGVHYDGIADIAFIAIASANGKFGGVRTANAHYFAAKGLTGIYAPGVAFQGPVFVGNISAFDTATPVLQLGSASDVRITGGDLLQDNGRAVQVSGVAQLKFADGSDSHGNLFPAKSNRARLEQGGADVTAQVVVSPTP